MLTVIAFLFFLTAFFEYNANSSDQKETFYIGVILVEFNKYSILNWKKYIYVIYHIYIILKGYSTVVTINYLET